MPYFYLLSGRYKCMILAGLVFHPKKGRRASNNQFSIMVDS